MTKKNSSGFTVVEVVMVVVILGILATVAVFAVQGNASNGVENSCAVEKRTVETAIAAYYTDNDQTNPVDVDVLIPDYLEEDPSDRWIFTPSATSAWPTINGTGDCA